MYSNFSLREYNTFGLDVAASKVCVVHGQSSLEKLFMEGVFRNEKMIVLGGGSNVLFLDDYIEGLVVLIENKGIFVSEESDDVVLVSVAAGEDWASFVSKMVASGYYGVENLSLIPGKVGAAPMQNIGAYGVELKDVFVRLLAFDTQSGALVEFARDECEFGYRTSVFKTSFQNRFIILSVELQLRKHADFKLEYGTVRSELDKMGVVQPSLSDVSDAIINIRQSKLPDPRKLGNAGSFFKNPVVHTLVFDALKREFPDIVGYVEGPYTVKLAAGWLIEKAGWKAFRRGDAGVHDKQALVLVNHGKATGREIYGLAMEIQYAVKQRFGVLIEPEVNVIGAF
jgi:UDP-N-acetylmuramate dehydrogenase